MLHPLQHGSTSVPFKSSRKGSVEDLRRILRTRLSQLLGGRAVVWWGRANFHGNHVLGANRASQGKKRMNQLGQLVLFRSGIKNEGARVPSTCSCPWAVTCPARFPVGRLGWSTRRFERNADPPAAPSCRERLSGLLHFYQHAV